MMFTFYLLLFKLIIDETKTFLFLTAEHPGVIKYNSKQKSLNYLKILVVENIMECSRKLWDDLVN